MSVTEVKNNQFSRRGVGENLSCLLGLGGNGRILLIGKHLAEWQSVFPGCNFAEKCSVIPNGDNTYDLILYHSCSSANWKNFQSDLEHLVSIVGLNGWILFFAENFFSPIKIKDYKHFFSRIIDRFHFRPLKMCKNIELAGLSIVKSFVGLPTFISTEEFVIPTSRFLELPLATHFLLRLARNFGRYHTVADGQIVLTGPHKIEDCQLLKVVEKNLNNVHATEDRYIVERLDFRYRGALILFMVQYATKKSLIYRVISDIKIQTIVKRNHFFIKYLYESLAENELINKIPRPVMSLNYKNVDIFVEELVSGVVAWKVNKVSLKSYIHNGAFNFILDFNIALMEKTYFCNSIFSELFDNDISILEKSFIINKNFLQKIKSISRKIFILCKGKYLLMSASHGDYGYGNILVNPKNGQITGVIDWDRGKKLEFPGVDYINLLVQHKLSEEKCEIDSAFISVCSDIIKKNSIDADNNYFKKFNLNNLKLHITIYVCFFRYICRSAQYIEMFLVDEKKYIEILNFLECKIPLDIEYNNSTFEI